MKVDITEKSLRKMKVAYIRKHKAHLRNNGRGQKRAARLLGVSDRFIQKVLADDNVDNYDFFEEEND